MVNRISSITFFFPYHEVSGVPVLFSRMARHISEKYGVSTYIIDYPDGYMSQTLKNSSVGIRHIVDGEPLHVTDDTILVMQAGFPDDFPPELIIDDNCRIIFWVLHPLNLVPAFISRSILNHASFHKTVLKTILRPLTLRIRKLITDMVKHNSLYFMDGSTYSLTTERIGVAVASPVYLPVPSDDVTGNLALTCLHDSHRINFCWLGRLCDFKINILLHLMEKLSQYADAELCITLHIIGDGPDAQQIKDAVHNSEFFKVIMLGTLAPAKVDAYLKKHIDVVAAMGTSALEAARLGIPTILLDYSYSPIQGDYLFKWIYKRINYSLADLLTSDHCQSGNDSLLKMIGQLKTEYELLSIATYNYYISNHSISSVADKFMTLSIDAGYRYYMIDKNLRQQGSVRRSYECFKSAFYSIKLCCSKLFNLWWD